MDPLPAMDVLRITTVLEECWDQLCILGYIMPISYQGKSDAENIIGSDINKILNSQKELDSRPESLPSAKTETRKSRQLHSLKDQLQDITTDLKRSNYLYNKSIKQSALSTSSLKKVDADRQFAADVIYETLEEFRKSGTFQSLLQAVNREKEKKSHFYDTIVREEEGRKRIKALQKQLQDIKKEKEEEVQNRNEMIAHLKDQVQEMKAKTNMEGKYVKNNTELQVFQTQKKSMMNEGELLAEGLRLKEKIEEEFVIHTDLENFLKRMQVEIEEKLEFWMEKYDKDTESKQLELNTLKNSKANDLVRLQELAKQYREHEQVIIDDRIEKEEQRQKVEQDVAEYRAVIKLQAWWRGLMVRKGLGPFKPTKTGKKGKDAGKDKGKGKGKGKGKK
ncbi:dynein regulatory complex protein 9 [Latimeria chalumnae]|uniref:Dynein regulatory complex protein 9 n=1 Tax=Latimeria chalumnae TaxID=7897 RepID=H3A5I7_LATCH|nr:PREDICTED: IQ domain-containing protein G [Latimeria chalumnae]XP_014344678.1 PREDICTED: IQ domain-containing protein G [Latimeria chalumnae]XP_014344679.1 PREDICTED: IQ domain-containing protein G [Latimeria chalumnae]|eukprot:XP_005997404.1 PREDICTED: IQ domain-containing protein G [Latimeria chalumnae]